MPSVTERLAHIGVLTQLLGCDWGRRLALPDDHEPCPVDRSRLVTECVDGCVLADLDHDCCAHEHSECDGQGCEGCHQGLLWQPS